jgi:hypothetical protein
MKKPTIILSFLFVTLISYGTNVTGGIYSNTIWTVANSPYIVTDTVMVFPGVILTIQPGVVVKFNSNGLLEVRGSLSARGTTADSIIFTSNSSTPKASDYLGVIIETSTDTLTYCRFSYSSWGLGYDGYLGCPPVAHCAFTSNLAGISMIASAGAAMSLDTCTFKYDTIGIERDDEVPIIGCTFLYNGTAINMPAGAYSPIENCIIEYNNNGILSGMNNIITHCTIDYNRDYGVTLTGGCNISYCEIENNYIGIKSTMNNVTYNNISHNYIGIETSGGDSSGGGIFCNSFCNNTDFNFIIQTSVDIPIKDNFWCLTDSAQIQATIYDGYQKITLGLAFFTPFYTSPCSGTPSAINALKNNYGNVKVFPNPNNGKFSIESDMINEKSIIEIYNVLGEKVYKVNLNADITEINLSTQPKGIYLYRVIEQNGNLIGEGKVIIE